MKISNDIKKLSVVFGVTCSFLTFGLTNANADVWKGPGGIAPKPSRPIMKVAAGCEAPTSSKVSFSFMGIVRFRTIFGTY